jgi:hypothetical protein
MARIATITSRAVRYRPLIIAAILAGSAGVIGIVHAVLPNLQLEAENGTFANGSNIAVISDANASNGGYIRFNQPVTQTCPAGQVGTPPNCVSANSALQVNAGTVVNSFDKKIKGFGFANWNFGWGRPYLGNIPKLNQAITAIDPGIIRYAGGLWANYVGFDRNRSQQALYSDWTYNGKTYSFNYGTNELKSLDTFAKSINADVMIQVNISNNEPSMWADLVRWAKEQGLTSFKYYELGNELDLESTYGNNSAGMTPTEYGTRLRAYQQAMLAVDPNINIVGGVPAAASDIMRNFYASGGNQVSQYITQGASAARAAGRDLSVASFHWYQGGDTMSTDDVFFWSWGYPATSGDWWRNSYSREWSGLVTPWIRNAGLSGYPNTQLGISELGVSSADNMTINANHVGALWYSDVLGRLAYTGTDWITQWNSYASSGEYFSLIYPDNADSQNPNINVRPTYDAYLMYAKYFGDQMVQSSTYDNTKLSIWASKDSDDPGKLKLRITNFTGSAINAPIALTGFTATGGQAYTLSSTNPTDTSVNSTTSAAPTTINNVKIDGNNVAASLASIQPTTVNASGTSFSYNVPAYSSVAIVLSGSF